MIDIIHLNKYLDKELIIKDVSINIKDNCIYGLVGVNGAGKSTLLRLISGVYKPTTGNIKINDEEVFDNPNVKKDILFISDEPYYKHNDTIKDIKRFYETFYNLDAEKFNYYINKFEIIDNKPLHIFSKGMRRRVFIAIAFAIAPKILLLDEVFDGLDPFGKNIFKKELVKLLDEKEMTVVMASHSIKEIEDICDSFGLINNGTVVSNDNFDCDSINMYKVLAVYKDINDLDVFKDANIISSSIVSKFMTLIVKGKKEDIYNYFNSFDPITIEVLDLTLEEVFLYEMEAKE